MSAKTFSDGKRTVRILLTILLIAVLAIAFWGKDSKQVSLEFREDDMILSAPEEDAFRVTIAYKDVSSMELLTELVPGVCLSGTDSDIHKTGRWSNEAYGDYTLCISPGIPACIVLDTADGIVVFNYESSDTTIQLFDALTEHIEKKTAENG